MSAYDETTGQSAVLDFGPVHPTDRLALLTGHNVPGDLNFAAHMPTLDEVKRDYASLTIQTNPEDAQKAIQAIKSTNPVAYNVYEWDGGANCTTVCRDILHKVLGLQSNSIKPSSLWEEAYKKWSQAALSPRKNTLWGPAPIKVEKEHGQDYGQPRYGMNTFDFVWKLLHPTKACVTTPGLNGGPPETVCN